MKRALALEKLDEAVGEQMANLLKVLVSNTIARDETAVEKFSSGFNSLVKSYDEATGVILNKLTN